MIRIPFHKPLIGKEEEEEVLATLRSGWLTTGERAFRFERDFAEYIGCKHAVSLSSCTAGLHLALVLLGVRPGDEVITTPITWPATANVIVHCGARPVFADVEPDTLNIDPADIKRKITGKTKAIIPVHLAGHPCDMFTINALALWRGIRVVEDAAHALEASYKGVKVGTLGDSASFSFYPNKNMTTGEGGMLTTDNDELAEKARIYRMHGISKDAWKRYGSEGYKHWETLHAGYKYNLPDTAAAIGIHQLKRVEGWLRIRRRYAEMYDEAIREIPEVQSLTRGAGVRHAHHLYIVQVDTDALAIGRDAVMDAIQAGGVGVGIHFPALHLQSYYRDTYGYKRGDLPVAERASDRILSLPLYPAMTEDDVGDVVAVVKKVVRRHKR